MLKPFWFGNVGRGNKAEHILEGGMK